METMKKLVQWVVDLETLNQRKDQVIAQRDQTIKQRDARITKLEKELADAKPASE